MGLNDKTTIPFYKKHILPVGVTALLGFSNNNLFEGDTYDLSLGNWEINSEWGITKMYNTVICTRCAYFAKSPFDFFKKCYGILEFGGKVYVDWGLGDHWRFKNFKVGWVKDSEHEFAYKDGNFLWSMVWDDSLIRDYNVLQFSNAIKEYGYDDLLKAIYEEIPSVSFLKCLEASGMFKFEIIKTIYMDKPNPSILVLLSGEKI